MAYWRPYVPVRKRRAQADRLAKRMKKNGESLERVVPQGGGRKIATSVWGQAWCENLERYHDYENRLPRGRTYVRNGSVIDLKVETGRIDALVQGRDLYRVGVRVENVAPARWRKLSGACAAEIGTLVELLEGRISASVMAVMTERGAGLFPEPREITMSCSCPDWATMCKHVAAVLYGVGVRLDAAPALLFQLRGVDPTDLIGRASVDSIVAGPETGQLAGDLESIFGIELDAKPTGGRIPTAGTNGAATTRKTSTHAAKQQPGRATIEPARATKPSSKKPPKPRRSKPTIATRGRVDASALARRVFVITRRELLDRGVTASTLTSWSRRGILQSAGSPGTYAWTSDLELQIRAAVAPRRGR